MPIQNQVLFVPFQELRSADLPALLEHYFSAFHHYIKDVVTEFTFEDFSKEFYERRDGALGMSLLVRLIVLKSKSLLLGHQCDHKKITKCL